jgi:hypothetical protein
MPAISAVDAVSAAVQRTREFLFKPFSWGTYLKLGLVAIITEGLGGNLNSSQHNNHSTGGGSGLPASLHFKPEWIAAIVFAALLAILLSMFVAYLITRLRFAYFHCLVTKTKLIRPGWHLYAGQASRFFWLNIGVGLCFVLLVGLIAIPFAAGFWHVFQEHQLTGHIDVSLAVSLVLPLIPIILLLVLLGTATDLILRDLMLPQYALEDASAGEAWHMAWAQIMTEKKEFFVYAVLRLVLPIVAMVALFMVLFIPGLMLVGSLAAVELGIHSAFADSTGGSAVVGILLQGFFGVLAFGFALLASICLGGPVSTGIREYALVFYGGRYRALGEAMSAPAPGGFPATSGIA